MIAYGEGLNETGLTTDSEAEFTVDYTAAGDGELQVNIEGPAGGVELDEAEIEEGVKRYIYHTDPEENGCYVVQIKFADEDIPGSPFSVDVKWKSDPSRVIAEGSGLEGGTSKELAEFTVDLQKAGDGELDVDIDGPCPVKINSLILIQNQSIKSSIPMAASSHFSISRSSLDHTLFPFCSTRHI